MPLCYIASHQESRQVGVVDPCALSLTSRDNPDRAQDFSIPPKYEACVFTRFQPTVGEGHVHKRVPDLESRCGS